MTRGFTLIETIIYIALLASMLAGAVFTAYNLIESSDHLSADESVQAEGNFVIRKIDWALASASSESLPSAHELVVTRIDGSNVDVKLSGSEIDIKESGGIFEPLTSVNVSVTDLEFTIVPAAGTGPKQVTASATIHGSVFSTTKYVPN